MSKFFEYADSDGDTLTLEPRGNSGEMVARIESKDDEGNPIIGEVLLSPEALLDLTEFIDRDREEFP